MSCAGKGYGTNPQTNNYLYAQFDTSFITSSVRPKSSRVCRKYNGSYPSFDPLLFNLSSYNCNQGEYALIYVTGANFFPNGTTYIEFGTYGKIPALYYSSYSLSFVVPINVAKGNYEVRIVNIYNGNFSLPVNTSWPGNLNYSTPIYFTIA